MDIAKIKQMVSIPDFLNFLGCVPTDHKDGRYLHYRSPLREDNKPSFWVDTQKGICGDFNGDRIGDVINLAERYYNCDFKTAAANIADSFRWRIFISQQAHSSTADNPGNKEHNNLYKAHTTFTERSIIAIRTRAQNQHRNRKTIFARGLL